MNGKLLSYLGISTLLLTFSSNSWGALNFPNLDPTAFSIGSFNVQWYGLFYLIGLSLMILVNHLLLKSDHQNSPTYNKDYTSERFIEIAVNCFLFAIVGGRIAYVFIYNWGYYSQHLNEIIYLHQGGMSFHGGLVGAIFGLWVHFRNKPGFWGYADLAATVAPLALMVGRCANFINDELWGRTTDVPWAIKFPRGGYVPRHPSQLYEAFFEGLVLFLILLYVRKQRIPRPALLSGIFIAGYGIARFIVEFYREPDAQIGYIMTYFTQGQILCLPMIVVGLLLVSYSKRWQQPE